MSFDGDLYPEAGASKVITSKGDLVRGNASGDRERYGIGSTGQVLSVASGTIDWTTLTTADSVLTTQGDILYEGASGLTRLGFGTSGDVLTTKGTGADPAWETPTGGATLSNQTTGYTDNQTTTSSSLVDITGSSWTLPTRTGGKAYIVQFVTVEANGQRILAGGLYYDGADQACGTSMVHASGQGICITVSAITDLDGGSVVGRWRTSGGTATLKNSGNGKSECTSFEVS